MLEKGPPFAGSSGGAVGGSPAQLHSAEHTSAREPTDVEQMPVAAVAPSPPAPGAMRLTGYAAIEYAEKQGLPLNKHPDSITGPRMALNVAEAKAIAEEEADLIWLDVAEQDYYSGPPSNYEPDR